MSTTREKRKKVVVSMVKRLEALRRLDNGEPVRKIAEIYGVGSTTVWDWKKKRNKIVEFCTKMEAKDALGNRGTLRSARDQVLDETLYAWFVCQRDSGNVISGPMLRQKALNISKKLNGDTGFTASTGWLQRWKIRHGIRQLPVNSNISSNPLTSETENFTCVTQDHSQINAKIKEIAVNTLQEATTSFSVDTQARQLVFVKTEENEDNCNKVIKKTETSVTDCEQKYTLLQDNLSENSTTTVKKEIINHEEASEMFQQLLDYVSVQEDTSSADLGCLTRLRNRAVEKRNCML